MSHITRGVVSLRTRRQTMFYVLLTCEREDVFTVNGYSSCYCYDGYNVQASYCIVALAPPLQSRIRWSPALSATRCQMLQRLPMGSVIKTFMYYNTPFWRHKGVHIIIGAFLLLIVICVVFIILLAVFMYHN